MQGSKLKVKTINYTSLHVKKNEYWSIFGRKTIKLSDKTCTFAAFILYPKIHFHELSDSP